MVFETGFVSTLFGIAGMWQLKRDGKWLIKNFLCCPLGPLIGPIYMQMVIFISPGKWQSTKCPWLMTGSAFVKKLIQTSQSYNYAVINTQTANTHTDKPVAWRQDKHGKQCLPFKAKKKETSIRIILKWKWYLSLHLTPVRFLSHEGTDVGCLH